MDFVRIESDANKKIKLAASLHQRKNREKEGLFLAEGVRLCEMVAESSWKVKFALVTEQLLSTERGRALADKLSAVAEVCLASEKIFLKAAATEQPQGILLVVEQQKNSLQDVQAAENPLYVVLDGVQDPGNVGTIIRTADAAGASAVLCTKGTADVFSDKVVRSTMGSLFHLPLVTGLGAEGILGFARARNCELLVTALDESAQPLYGRNLARPIMLVFGNEGNGVSAELLSAGEKTYIPMVGGAESLNVGVSAAVVLFEALRQRKFSHSQQR